ncbi:restriction endonuclease subunit S [Streptomyces sp. NPDC101225]|uniref:restriction endonuclease subunit S n=1 Tax=Streptomyces sp. NPDC101225 TaxID=3366135 RepID=UPI0037FD63F8
MTAVPLGELFLLIRNGMNVRQDKSGDGIPITRIETISKSIVDPSRVGYAGIIPGVADEWLLRAGDILFSHINSVEHVGKCALYEGEPKQLIHGMNLLCLRCDPSRLAPEYAVHLLRTSGFRAKLLPNVKRAVNQASVSIRDLSRIPVDVPSLPRQRQIAAALDRIDALYAKRRQAIALLDDLTESVFRDMFGNPATNSRGWERKRLGSLGRVVTGNTPSRTQAENYGGRIEWIKSDNIRRDAIYLTEASERLSEVGMRKARFVGPGSLLVTCIAGSPSSIGNVAIADREVAFNQQINAFTPSDGNPLFYYFLLRLVKSMVLEKSTGGMKGLVSKSRFESIALIDPPLALKEEFSLKVRAALAVRDAQRSQNLELDALFASVRHRAFRGELWGEGQVA